MLFSYVVDCVTELYVWLGKKSNQEQRKLSIKVAEDLLLSRKGRPSWVTLAKLHENTGNYNI